MFQTYSWCQPCRSVHKLDHTKRRRETTVRRRLALNGRALVLQITYSDLLQPCGHELSLGTQPCHCLSGQKSDPHRRKKGPRPTCRTSHSSLGERHLRLPVAS